MVKLERIHLISRPEMLKPLRKWVKELIEKQGLKEKSQEDIILAVNEACMNVIQHAYNKKNNEEIIIEFWKTDKELIIKIFDFADAVDIEKIKSRDLSEVRPGGLGVHIMHELMDGVKYSNNASGKGNMLELKKVI